MDPLRCAVLVTVVASALASAATASADSTNGATVFQGGDRPGVSCAVAASITGAEQLNTFDYTEVQGPQAYVLTCHFQYPAGSEPTETFRVTGMECGTTFGATFDTQFVATPSGRATLTCIFNGTSRT